MINDQININNRDNEPEETRNLNNDQLIKYVGLGKELPDKGAGCSVRQYYIRIHNNTAYSVQRLELLTFEANLSPGELEISPFFNIPVLSGRLDRLLRHKNKPPLNFPPGKYADLSWTRRILRFEDPWNLLSAFKRAVRGNNLPLIDPGRM